MKKNWLFFIMLGVVVFLFLLHIGRNEFWDWDECIYLLNAQSIHTTHQFLTNTWNFLPVPDKPPLYPILLQIPFLFGINAFNARILSVLFTGGILCAIYFFCKKEYSQKIALLSSLLFLTGDAAVIYASRLNTDLGYTFFIFCAFILFYYSWKNKKFSYFAGLFLGLAVMMKGLSIASFLLVFFISVFLPFRKEKLLSFIKMIAVLLIVIIPWHVYEYITNRDLFLQMYFYDNIIKRASHPIEFHFTSRLFYFKQLGYEFFPWILSLGIAPLFFIKKWRSVIKDFLNREELFIFIFLLAVIPIGVLTKAQTRLQWYAIPLYPFFAILIARSISSITDRFKSNALYILVIVLISVDVGHLIAQETDIMNFNSSLSLRNEAFVQARKYPEKDIYNLVQFSERRAKEVLAPELTIYTTFMYGGNTCAPYYSGKKVHFFYSVDEFRKVIQNKGLFIVFNGEQDMMKESGGIVRYRNSDFILFEK